MKISKAEMRILVKHFKKLVEADVVGVTSSDARNAVSFWLDEIGQTQTAKDFEHAVFKYQNSPKIVKLQEKYDSQ